MSSDWNSRVPLFAGGSLYAPDEPPASRHRSITPPSIGNERAQPTHAREVPLNGRRQTGHASCTSEDVATASSTSSAVDGSSTLAARVRRPPVATARETRRPATRGATCARAAVCTRAAASIVAVLERVRVWLRCLRRGKVAFCFTTSPSCALSRFRIFPLRCSSPYEHLVTDAIFE